MPTPLIVDTDPGRDDAVALILACGAPGLDLRAVSTVAGNVPVDKTTRNALKALELAGRPHIPVAAGAEKPLYRELTTAEHVHGDSGLYVSRASGLSEVSGGPGGLGQTGQTELSEPNAGPDGRDAVGLMADTLEAYPEPVTLVAIGPLTNVARLLDLYPGLREKIRRVILMGGSIGPGNATPAAEFNVYTDPEAARAVFDDSNSSKNGPPVTMVGLDVTRRALATEDDLRRLRSLGEVGETVAGLIVEPGWRPGSGRAQPVHDAVAVAAALEPGIIRTRPMRVEVECAGEHTTGETVCDVEGVTGEPPNAEVAVDLDAGRIIGALLDSVERLEDSKGQERP